MSELPVWPPIAAIAFGLIALGVLKFMSWRLDRGDDEARRKQHPAE
jgi:hypothetical protein